MAATNTGVEIRAIDASSAGQDAETGRLRNIDPRAGRALEILGHAIEYLTDEYVHGANLLSSSDPQVEAIQLLMTLNRKIYYECSVVPTLAERLRAFFGIAAQ